LPPSLLDVLLTHCGEVSSARIRPDQIKNELHFGHPLPVSDHEDTQPFVSGWFRRLRNTVSSRTDKSRNPGPVQAVLETLDERELKAVKRVMADLDSTRPGCRDILATNEERGASAPLHTSVILATR
jgi:hypothetical protein